MVGKTANKDSTLKNTKFYSNNKQLEYYGYGYDAQHLKSLPNEPHDLKLKHVITEKKIYEF